MIETIKRRPGLTVFLVAFALRLVWILTLKDVLVWPDEQEFAAIAEHLTAGDGYVSNSYRTNPVVPVYLAAFFKLFGTGLLAPRIGQAAIGGLTCVVLGRLASLLAGPTAGLIAGLMLAVYPAHIYLSGVFYVACIATYLSLLAIWL
ncbi:MAG: glycosyltransferase family 39 protein, partial [Candidatus Binatia bacterium]